MSYKDAFSKNHTDFKIKGIKYEDDTDGSAESPNEIELEYSAPDIAVDTSGRFVTHKIVGGATVRQKIGEDPIEVEVEGVCKEQTARHLDGLRNAEYGTIFSNRLLGGALDVQFASTSTSPLDSGGAVAMADEDGEFLYTFTISAVEVDLPGQEK